MTYIPNPKGISRYLNEDPELRRCLEQRAYLGLATAVAAAPRGHTGRFSRSGSVVFDGAHQGVHHDRMSYSVVFDDPAAVAIVFGTSDTPSHLAMMQAALGVMGIPGHDPGA